MTADYGWIPPEEAALPAEASAPQEAIAAPVQPVPEEDRTFPTETYTSVVPQKKAVRKKLTTVAAILAAAGITTLAGTALSALNNTKDLLHIGELKQEVAEAVTEYERAQQTTAETETLPFTEP